MNEDGTIKKEEIVNNNEVENWDVVSKANIDNKWYSYTDNKNNNAKVNAPILKGNMKPIQFDGDENSAKWKNSKSKWANAITSDGSMWVWIPRYAYKIKYNSVNADGTPNKASGTIDVAFINTKNEFLNGEEGTIITNPSEITYTGNTQDQWLVHPAFIDDSKNEFKNGGWDKELSGIWFSKFEATGNYKEDSKGNILPTSNLSSKPGVEALRFMTINQMYKFALNAKYGEEVDLNSHMIKNSEWGAIAYLTISKYGTNGKDLEKQKVDYTTGGSKDKNIIFNTNYKQSTTINPYGVYDLRGTSYEAAASYANYANSTYLKTYGGTNEGDLYGATKEEQSQSTKYKTVYQAVGINQLESYELLGTTNIKKGDAIYETSSIGQSSNSWNPGSGASIASAFPTSGEPFFIRGGRAGVNDAGLFCFAHFYGQALEKYSFRMVLAF